jgi:TBC1 domain family protein 5
MHELLAPVLWVVERDAIEKKSLQSVDYDQSGNDLMLQLLDETFVEHDSFTLFCAIMQVTRIYYEPGEQRSEAGQIEVAPIVGRCQYIHQGLLMVADEELAEHLYAIEILPQIFLT